MIPWRLISRPYARKHPLRSVLTVFAIGLGVAIFVGMHAAGNSVLSALNTTIDRIAGKTQLQVTSGEAGFPEEVLERVQSVPEVAVAAPVIEAVMQTGLAREGNLLVLGVDMTGDRSLREYDLESGEQDIVDDPLVFLAQSDSLIVTRSFAERNRLAVETTIVMQTMDGERKFTVRGIMRPGGLSTAFGGNLAVMDIYAAQKVFGRGRRFDRIDIRLKDDCSLDRGQVALRQAIGPGFQVDVPAARGRQFESLLQVYSFMVNVTSLFALFIGLFIIHNAFSVAVIERRAEIAIVRALGASRVQVIAVFATEGAIVGLIGSALGVALGAALATVMATYVGELVQAQYGISAGAPVLAVSPRLVFLALAMGTATSTLTSLLPAGEAARVDPVRALQRGRVQVLSAGKNNARQIAAGIIALLAVSCATAGHSRGVFYLGYFCFVLAALLVVPTLFLWLSRMLHPALRILRPVEGALAADSLLQAPRRTSATVAALMLSVGLIVSLGGVSRGAYSSIIDWVDSFLNSDLMVSASENGVTRDFHFPDAMTPKLLALQNVADVHRIRSSKIAFNGASVLLVALDMERAAARSRGRAVSGDFDEMHHAAAQGKSVIVSETLSALQNVRLGDTIELPSPSGLLRLRVAGVVPDYMNQSGSIFLDYAQYVRYWGDATVDLYKVYLKPGADAEAARIEIYTAFSHDRRLFVWLNREVAAGVMRNTRQWLGLSYLQIAVAMVVAVLGIANTLLVSVTDRRRELATIRAVGGSRGNVRRAVWLEAISIAVIGALMGIAFGAVDLLYQLHIVRHDYAGLELAYAFPWGLVGVVAAAMVCAAVISSIAASEWAARTSLVESLAYE